MQMSGEREANAAALEARQSLGSEAGDTRRWVPGRREEGVVADDNTEQAGSGRVQQIRGGAGRSIEALCGRVLSIALHAKRSHNIRVVCLSRRGHTELSVVPKGNTS
jgi:hypothetical protein